jgi:hypothetical protein
MWEKWGVEAVSEAVKFSDGRFQISWLKTTSILTSSTDFEEYSLLGHKTM